MKKSCIARVEDILNENDNYLTRVKQIQNEDVIHVENIQELEKENAIFRAREIFFYVCFVFIMVYDVVGCLCCTYKMKFV